MENTGKFKLLIVVLILALLVVGKKLKDSQNQVAELRDTNEDLENQLDDYSSALDEANDNIDQANSNIEEARDYAGSSYDEMYQALDDLETVDTVTKP